MNRLLMSRGMSDCVQKGKQREAAGRSRVLVRRHNEKVEAVGEGRERARPRAEPH